MKLRPQRRLGWVWVGLTAGTLANALRLRARVLALPSIPDDPAPPATGMADGMRPDSAEAFGYVLLTGSSVTLDEATRMAAVRYACNRDLDVLDLVPADLCSERALELVRGVDPRTYAASPLATGQGPRQATLVRQTVLERAAIAEVEQLGRLTYTRITGQLKRFAPTSSDLAVAPGLAAAPEETSGRRAYLSARYGSGMPIAVGFESAQCALWGAGLLVTPGWGMAALGSYCAQPYLAIAGSVLRPTDLTLIGALSRPLRRAWAVVRTLAEPPDREAQGRARAAADDRRTTYGALLDGGLDRFFAPRRSTCPLCSETSLSSRLRTTDLLQFKPGEFELDECAACGHIFQNPRLSLAGLDFYYRDFYDGLGEEMLELVFSSNDTLYRSRIRMVASHAQPQRWLDVGAGHGHFCLVAAGLLPQSRFDGLDMSTSILEAERRRWIDRAYVGQFTEVSDDLLGAYDVVSMHHYLEHTPDPAGELRSAAKVLAPGGHLLIEVPDPECAYARLLGRMWLPWLQPQHLHLLSRSNLTRLLSDNGFVVVGEDRAAAHSPIDLSCAVLLHANRIAGPPSRPWLESPALSARVRRMVSLTALLPLCVPALLLDQMLAPIVRRLPRGPNAYRVLARRS
jgi:SAM-dependent methyltransferase